MLGAAVVKPEVGDLFSIQHFLRDEKVDNGIPVRFILLHP